MDRALETILRCPVSGLDLAFLAPRDLEALRSKIRTGRLRHLNGAPVRLDPEAALATPDGRYAYPVVEGIFVLLPGMAIADESAPALPAEADIDAATQAVMQFYDEVGWKKADSATYADARLFEDLRPVSQEYIHRCHLRLRRHFPQRGTYLLDAASGPIQYAEYLTYSEGYECRLCADVSYAALIEAKQKLGERGAYLQCDLQHLPLKDGVVDGFVSLHTLYHVPAAGQRRAIMELLRVLKEEGQGVVVYSWGERAALMRLLMPKGGWLGGIRQRLRRGSRTSIPAPQAAPNASAGAVVNAAGQNVDPGVRPGFFAHDYGWYRRELAPLSRTDLACWRSVSVRFLRGFIRPGFLGRQFLRLLFALESAFPRFFGRYGQYPALIFRGRGAR